MCTVDGCSKKVKSEGLCKSHGMKPCWISDCSAKAVGRGLCRKHGAYGKCILIDCSTNAEERGGYCNKHKARAASPIFDGNASAVVDVGEFIFTQSKCAEGEDTIIIEPSVADESSKGEEGEEKKAKSALHEKQVTDEEDASEEEAATLLLLAAGRPASEKDLAAATPKGGVKEGNPLSVPMSTTPAVAEEQVIGSVSTSGVSAFDDDESDDDGGSYAAEEGGYPQGGHRTYTAEELAMTATVRKRHFRLKYK